MKKLVCLILVLVSLVTVGHAEVYPAVSTVIDVDHNLDFVAFETLSGHVYVMFGAEDWMVEDVAALLLDDMGTERVDDDEIVMALYNGRF